MVGRHGRNGKGVVRGGGDGGRPGIAPSADAPPLRRGRGPLMPMVVVVLLWWLMVVAVTAGHAASPTAAARRVGDRGGRRQPRRLAAALHVPALFLPHNNLGTKFKSLTQIQISRRPAGSLFVLLYTPTRTNNTFFL